MSWQAVERVLATSASQNNERLVAIVLAEATRADGRDAYPSVPTIAARARCGESTVRKALASLVERGEWVEDGVGPAGTRRFHLVLAEAPATPRSVRARPWQGSSPADPAPPQDLHPRRPEHVGPQDLAPAPQDLADPPADPAPEPSFNRPKPSTEPPVSVEPDRLDVGRVVRDLFAYWQATCGHPNAKLVAKRRRAVEGRLREGYTEAEIRKAIDGAAKAAHVSDQGVRFDDLALICRDGTKVELNIKRAAGASGARPAIASERDDFSQYDQHLQRETTA